MPRSSPDAPATAWRALLAAALMSVAVTTVYAPPRVEDGAVQLGMDYTQLHQRRMAYGREAILGPSHSLPAWYPRELLGAPFWANPQSFPFLPSRLAVLLAFDPAWRYAYAAAVVLAANLAALFTFLFARRIGLGVVGAAVAGATFACCGYFAARVAAGHLPLLEAYGALPLLLWGVESLVAARERAPERDRAVVRRTLALGMASAAVVLAGHPQLPFYSLVAAAAYAVWRAGPRAALRPLTAMGLGVGCAGFALVPMALLVTRSTRVLALDPAGNDLVLPVQRLAAFFLPWRDGAVAPLPRAAAEPFTGYASRAHFWDTVVYAGWLPWIAVVVLAVSWLRLRRAGGVTPRAASFLALLGTAGVVLALPFVKDAAAAIPGTILRSPARLLYLTELSLAVAAGAGVELLKDARVRGLRAGLLLVPVVLLAHALDLGRHAREFIVTIPRSARPSAEDMRRVVAEAGDGRVAIDYQLPIPINRTLDDVGFFDSIILARPYRLLLDVGNARSPRLNIQDLVGAALPVRMLQVAAVRLVLTVQRRRDLPAEVLLPVSDPAARSRGLPLSLHRIPAPAERAGFFPASRIRFLDAEGMRRALRDPAVDLLDELLLPLEAERAEDSRGGPVAPAVVRYERPDGDRIACAVESHEAGYLRVVESFDPGWSATVNGEPKPVVPALGALLAVKLGPGRHDVRFVYRTPGARAGQAVSLASFLLLLGLARGAWAPRSRPALPRRHRSRA